MSKDFCTLQRKSKSATTCKLSQGIIALFSFEIFMGLGLLKIFSKNQFKTYTRYSSILLEDHFIAVLTYLIL